MHARVDLIGFSIAVLLIELTPGPNMGWLVALTLSEGKKSGLAAIVGIALGLASNAVISVLAASFVLQHSPVLLPGISILGAAMMAYLAWQAWQDAGESSHAATPERSGRNFLAGFTINLLNPKASLFLISIIPQVVADARPTYLQALILAAVSVAIATAVHLGLVIGAEKVRPALLKEKQASTVRRVLAIGMLGVGGWFIVKAFG